MSKSSRALLAIAFVFTFSLGIRLARLPVEGIWGDEMRQVNLSIAAPSRPGFRPWLGAALGDSLSQAQPPLSYLVVRGSHAALGFNLWGFRLPSIIAGSLACAGLTAVGWLSGSLSVGLAAGLVPATLFWHISQSAQARPYIWVFLIGGAQFWLWAFPPPGLRRGGGWRRYCVAYGLVTAAALGTNLFCFFFSLGLAGLDLLGALFARLPVKKRRLRLRFLAWSAAALAFLPYLLMLIRRQTEDGYHHPPLGAGAFLLKIWNCVMGGLSLLPRVFDAACLYHGLIVLALAAGIVWLVPKRRRLLGPATGTLVGAFMIGFALTYGEMGWWTPTYTTALMSAFAALLAHGAGMAAARDGRKRATATAMLGGLVVAGSWNSFANWKLQGHEDWREVTTLLHALPAKTALRYDPAWLETLNLRFAEELMKLPSRSFAELKAADQECLLSITTTAKSGEGVRELSGWKPVYDRLGVWIWCHKLGHG